MTLDFETYPDDPFDRQDDEDLANSDLCDLMKWEDLPNDTCGTYTNTHGY
jgi:hypothetical protein